jgi:hypothetical protein
VVRRLAEADAQERVPPVRIVFRPDLEWRSFHSVTKAQGAVEQAFGAPSAIKVFNDLNDPKGRKALSGFLFRPYGADERLEFAIANGEFHHEPQWTYCVPHPEEAERGQEPCGDLYSPGWISCEFQSAGDEAVLTAAYGRQEIGDLRSTSDKRQTTNDKRQTPSGKRQATNNLQSSILNLQSSILNLQSSILNPQSPRHCAKRFASSSCGATT